MNSICRAERGGVEDQEESSDGSCTVHTVDYLCMGVEMQ